MGIILILLALFWGRPTSAEPLACLQRLDCQQQRVMDLKDYREYLEGELALCKSLLNEARQQAVAPPKPKPPEKPHAHAP